MPNCSDNRYLSNIRPSVRSNALSFVLMYRYGIVHPISPSSLYAHSFCSGGILSSSSLLSHFWVLFVNLSQVMLLIVLSSWIVFCRFSVVNFILFVYIVKDSAFCCHCPLYGFALLNLFFFVIL